MKLSPMSASIMLGMVAIAIFTITLLLMVSDKPNSDVKEIQNTLPISQEAEILESYQIDHGHGVSSDILEFKSKVNPDYLCVLARGSDSRDGRAIECMLLNPNSDINK